VTLQAGQRAVRRADLAGFDHVLLATGIVPRKPPIPGIDTPRSRATSTSSKGARRPGVEGRDHRRRRHRLRRREFLTARARRPRERRASDDPADRAFNDEWGIDAALPSAAASSGRSHESRAAPGVAAAAQGVEGGRRTRQDHRLDPPHAAEEARRGDARRREYERIDDAGLHITVDGVPQVLPVDTVVVCAGQEPRRDIVAAGGRGHPAR
jgi:2,4-dienoyl-CoA reductase (NADPH2)